MAVIKKILGLNSPADEAAKAAREYRDLLRKEAKIGGEIFGPLPKGHRREFFCLDEHTWIWHEEYKDAKSGQLVVKTTRYNVRPSGIVKSQDNKHYQKVSDQEALRLQKAVKLYQKRVNHQLYNDGK